MSMRTDLAYESEQRVSAGGGAEGISKSERRYESAGFEVTEITVETEAGAELVGKPVGRYVTVRCAEGRLSDGCETAEERAECIAKELTGLIGHPERVLIAGLGNTQITPDSLGPRAAGGILATRHIKLLAKDLDTSELADVSVISAGVMAQTGVESQAVVKAICREVEPELVIVIDALACSELSHLGSTIQICDTGISPGSGVENARSELSEKTLGVKTIAIGIPTVTDLSSSECEGEAGRMMVTPKDIDSLIGRSSGLLSLAVNRALHPTLTQQELALLF